MSARVAVIGAGVAGLACAVTLSEAGLDVTVFDKGRAPGGRVSTARHGNVSFDHGAQFMAARGTDFGSILAELTAGGMAAEWPAASADGGRRCVGVPGMWVIPRAMAAWLETPPQQGRHVAWLERRDGWWLKHHAAADIRPGAVTAEGGIQAGPFDAVAVALPAPQAAALLLPLAPALAQQAQAAEYGPCWALMAQFDQPLDLPDTARPPSGPIRWLAREASRPARAACPERFVVHAAPGWSRDHLEDPAETVIALLLQALGELAPLSRPIAFAHRWRYALVERPLGEKCLWNAGLALGACGDWCIGGRVEAAWDSGRALAAAILGADDGGRPAG